MTAYLNQCPRCLADNNVGFLSELFDGTFVCNNHCYEHRFDHHPGVVDAMVRAVFASQWELFFVHALALEQATRSWCVGKGWIDYGDDVEDRLEAYRAAAYKSGEGLDEWYRLQHLETVETESAVETVNRLLGIVSEEEHV